MSRRAHSCAQTESVCGPGALTRAPARFAIPPGRPISRATHRCNAGRAGVEGCLQAGRPAVGWGCEGLHARRPESGMSSSNYPRGQGRSGRMGNRSYLSWSGQGGLQTSFAGNVVRGASGGRASTTGRWHVKKRPGPTALRGGEACAAIQGFQGYSWEGVLLSRSQGLQADTLNHITHGVASARLSNPLERAGVVPVSKCSWGAKRASRLKDCASGCCISRSECPWTCVTPDPRRRGDHNPRFVGKSGVCLAQVANPNMGQLCGKPDVLQPPPHQDTSLKGTACPSSGCADAATFAKQGRSGPGTASTTLMPPRSRVPSFAASAISCDSSDYQSVTSEAWEELVREASLPLENTASMSWSKVGGCLDACCWCRACPLDDGLGG